MPDLPELYEALDNQLDGLLKDIADGDKDGAFYWRVSALCAAIEVKQSQEFHEYLNKPNKLTVEYLRPIMQKAAKTKNCSGYGLDSSDFDWDFFGEAIEGTTTTETQTEA